jgi:NAD(P)-dependent dehydrogenase (short-subunit alcohol dehydrogenase family)
MRRVAMITGASGGIGAAAALLLAERGFRVVVNHRVGGRVGDPPPWLIPLSATETP